MRGEVERVELEKRRQNQRATHLVGKNPDGTPKTSVPMNSPAPNENGDTRDIVATAVGYGSGQTYERAKYIVENAPPETVAALDAGKISVNKAYLDTKKQMADVIPQIKGSWWLTSSLLYLYSDSFPIAAEHSLHTFFPLNELIALAFPQNTQAGSYLRRMIFSLSVKISRPSFSSISSVRRSSMGITTLPRSSTFLTIPVDFILVLLL